MPISDLQDALIAAHNAARAAVSSYEDTGACGFAWVSVEGNSPLARHCRKLAARDYTDRTARQLYGSKGYPKGHQWWCPGNFRGQSLDAHEAGARAFRDKLAEYGIRADVGSRLD